MTHDTQTAADTIYWRQAALKADIDALREQRTKPSHAIWWIAVIAVASLFRLETGLALLAVWVLFGFFRMIGDMLTAGKRLKAWKEDTERLARNHGFKDRKESGI